MSNNQTISTAIAQASDAVTMLKFYQQHGWGTQELKTSAEKLMNAAITIQKQIAPDPAQTTLAL